jgi:hypothetical protein
VDPLDVTIVSSLYGTTHIRFLEDWVSAITHLDPAPRRVILATSYCPFIPPVHVYQYRNCPWTHPQAWYLNQALKWVDTDWVWFVDIDDLAFPDALEGIDVYAADVVQVGFRRSDGEVHLPKSDGPMNQYVGASLVRMAALSRVGGFHDVADQDSDLWERLLEAGAQFRSADRPRFFYQRHPDARTEREQAA